MRNVATMQPSHAAAEPPPKIEKIWQKLLANEEKFLLELLADDEKYLY